MSRYLDQLVKILPPDVIHPNEEDIRIMRDIDNTLSDSREELKTHLKKLERRLVPNLHIGIQQSFNTYRNTRYGVLPATITPEIQEEHELRFRILQSVLAPSHILENGGIKSSDRIQAKVHLFRSWGRTSIHLPDISRIRVISNHLSSLDQAYHALGRLSGSPEFPFIQRGHFNYYLDGRTKYDSPYRGVNTHWALEGTTDYPDVDSLVTEVQFVTRRVRATMDLNHPFDVTKRAEYPSPLHKAWMHRVMLKASILDLEEYQSEKVE